MRVACESFDPRRPRNQVLHLICLACGYRFRRRVIHWRQLGLWRERLAQVRAIHCPGCHLQQIDTDPEAPSARRAG